jgi:hypothetical protein
MIRLLATVALMGGLLRYVFGERPRTRKPARRPRRRTSRPSAS